MTKSIGVKLIICYLIFSMSSYAQFSLSGEFRPRTEYRHGYNTLIATDQDPGFGIATRARLNAGFAKDSYEMYLSLQDVFVWGENLQIVPKDVNNSFMLFEAWGKFKFNDNFSTKLGRQILNYDDQRILGGLDWAQQGRTHDALLLTYKKNNFNSDFGFSYNQDYENTGGYSTTGNTYRGAGNFSYKTMQYAHLNNTWENLKASVLLMNNGYQNYDEDKNGDGISNLQTVGAHLNYHIGKLNLLANGYAQMGERQGEIDVEGAFLASIDAYYSLNEQWKIGGGYEVISGNDSEAGKTGAFFPLFGTNHKFNGLIDYFYVGNHANSVGLKDFHLNAALNFSKSSNLSVQWLNFTGQTALPSGEKSLGNEIDIEYTKKFNGFLIKAGYAQMFAQEGMYELKGLEKSLTDNTQNWIYLMLVLKPKFL